VFAVLVLTTVAVPASAAGPGVDDQRVLLGQSAALTGPASALGQAMRLGILAAFEEANARGGVDGRRLELLTYDDRYEPEAAIRNVNRLISEDQVFAIVGSVGTPTSQATQPIASDAEIPFIGPFTGAQMLREPYDDTAIHVRASYYQETEAIVAHLIEDLGLSRIAILYQDDSFGRAGLTGVRQALAKRGLSLVSEGTYMRNTTAVKTALLNIRKTDPEAVIVIGTDDPSAAFVKWARKLDMDPIFASISFVGGMTLAEELAGSGGNVMVTQVVPFPDSLDLPLIAEYQAALAEVDGTARPDFVSLEGYIVGRLVIAVLERTGRDLTRRRFLDTLIEIGHFEIGGLTLTFGKGDNEGLEQVFLTVIETDGTIRPVDRLAVP
jgi:ABC-type branched-subunit amino acid transport system substrate-binding protein